MSSLGWESVLVVSVVCLIMSAFFSGSETGYMSVSRVRLRRAGEGDPARMRQVMSQLQSIEQPILTCLIGTNLFNVLFSAMMTVALTTRYGVAGEWLALAVVSSSIILLAEIPPKVLYREYPERLVLASAPGISLSMVITAPLRWLLRGYLRMCGRVPAAGDETPTGLDRSGLAALLLTNVVPTAGDQRFAVALERYLKLAKRSLADIMRPVSDVVAVGVDSTVRECLDSAAASGYSRLPIRREDGRSLQSYVLVRDLIFLPREDQDQVVPSRLRRPFLLVDARMSPYELFEELRSQSKQLAAVTDPDGNPVGMITLEDLIERVLGSIQDEFDSERPERTASLEGDLR